MPLASGTHVGAYEVQSLLGHGGMGEVYRVRDPRLDRDIALKLLPETFAADPERLMRFQREARAIAALNHPNIVTVHSVESDGRAVFMTMELIEGKTLAALIASGRLTPDEILRLAIQLTDGVAAAHDRGITHRDLKPANVMVDARGQVKVLDFGIAKMLQTVERHETVLATDQLTLAGRIIGTVAYMSPEQAQGKAADPRSDVFSLGVILYELATGVRPFEGDTELAVLSSILKDTPPPVTELKRQLPNELARIVRRALVKDPSHRYPSAKELHNDLTALQADLASGTAVVSARSRPRTVAIAAMVAGIVIIAGLIGATWYSQRVGEPSTAARAITAAPGSTAANSDGRPRTAHLAVLPLRSIAASEDGYLGIGITDAVITRLSNVRSLRVRPTTAIIAFDGQEVDPQRVGQQLNVEHVLMGTLRRSGSTYRAAMQLIRTADGVAVWGQNFDVERSDLFRLEDEVAEQMVKALQAELTGEARRRLDKRYTTNAAAYALYLRGRALMVNYTEAKMQSAIDSFEQALALDADYAVARAGLATAFAWFSLRYAYEADATKWGRRAEDEARRALSQDGSLPEAHLALASAAGTSHRGFDWEASLAGLDTAVALDPSLELAHVGRARALYHLGLLDESRAAARSSLELNPQSTVELDRVLLAVALFGSRFTEAAERAQRLAKITDAPIVKNYYGQAQFYLSDRTGAIETLQPVMRGDQPDVRSQAALASVLAANGRQQEAGRIAGTLIAGPYMDHHVAYSLGATYAQLGQWTEAVKWLQTSAATGFPCYPWFAADPLLAPLRGRQEFQSLLSSVFARHEAARVKIASTSPSSSR